MKKLLCILLIAALAVSVLTAFPLNASAAASDKLTVVSDGVVIGEIDVGNEFIFNVSFNSGGYSVLAGQGSVIYNSNYVQLVEYGPVRSDGSVNMNAYCFPQRIRNSGLVSNYFEVKNEILFNFTKITGLGAFTEDDHFFKVRFKAIAPGKVYITYDAKVFYTRVNNVDIKLINHNRPNDQLDPIPYILTSAEPSVGYIGDADGDYNLTVMDATFIQYLTAGVDSEYNPLNADVDNNGEVNLRDALTILRYKAGVDTGTQIGEWIFASETAALS